jgi:hypothetical protein
VLKKTHFAGLSLQLEPFVCCSLNKRSYRKDSSFFKSRKEKKPLSIGLIDSGLLFLMKSRGGLFLTLVGN